MPILSLAIVAGSASASPPKRCRTLAKGACLRFCRGMKRAAILLPLLFWPLSAAARDSLGTFEQWGAFRDPDVPRCYAIAEPVRRSGKGAKWRAYASIGSWPREGVRGQVHFRLSKPRREGTKVVLSFGDRRFILVAGGADAWAADRRDDAAIIAAIRSGNSMGVSGTGENGRAFADGYALRGAATAIDAAALGCAKGR